MRKWLTLCMAFVSCASYSSATNAQVQILGGYRQDSVNFKIQTPRIDPEVATSSRFENVDIFQIGLRGRSTIGCNFYGRVSADIGWVLDGDHTERTSLNVFESSSSSSDISSSSCCCSDEYISGSVIETLRNRNIVDGRLVFDADIAFGYPCYFCECQAYLAPVVGYSYNQQYFTDDNNKKFTFDSSRIVYEHDCCTNKLMSHWYGPFVGLDFNYQPCGGCWNAYAAFEYHWANNKTKREVSSSFDSLDNFNHHFSSGHGWLVNIGLAYDWNECWGIGLDFVYRDYSASRHSHFDNSDVEEFFGSSLDGSFKASTKWRSATVNIALTRSF